VIFVAVLFILFLINYAQMQF